jgi:hypothetical protein
MEYKKFSYHKILVFFVVSTIVTLICGCNGGVPPVTEVNGTIDVNSTPSGANVYLDGENTGQVTPIVLTNIVAGDHIIELRKFHYYNWEDVVTVIAGQTTYLNPPLVWVPEESVALQPDGQEGKDAEVMSIFPEGNFGDTTFLSVGIFTVPFARSYLQFDLSSVPSEAVIIDANLGLYYDNSYELTSLPVGLYRVTESWTEETVTWDNQPTYFSEPSDIQILSNEQSNDFVYWQIIDLVEQWLAGSVDNYGMVLLDTDESSDDGGVEFFSSDWTTASQRPKLIIDYYIP